MANKNKDPETGKFTTDGKPKDKSYTLRLPENVLQWLKDSYGDSTARFIREAIAEKLEREQPDLQLPSGQQLTELEFRNSLLLTNS